MRFTLEKETAELGLPFLDLELKKIGNRIVSNWYRTKTDTDIVLNFHATVPKIYLSGFISGFVHRIFNSTSNRVNFHSSLENAAKILSDNQYPSGYIASIFEATLSKIISGKESVDRERRNAEKSLRPSLSLNLQYRSKPSSDFPRKLKTLLPSLNVYFTTIKLKNILSNLKSPVPSSHRSSVVYKFTCPFCSGTYVGQTVRNLFVRVKEHGQKGTPVGDLFKACGRTVDLDNE